MTFFEKAFVIHLVADWLLQNRWMTNNKVSVRHPAAWVHGAIHTVGMLLVFSWPIALALGAAHMLLDLRFPLVWWRGVFRQTQDGPVALHVAIWGDQVAHIACIALVVMMTSL